MTINSIKEWCGEGAICFNDRGQIRFKNRRRVDMFFPNLLFQAPLSILELLQDLRDKTSSQKFLLWIWATGIWDQRSDSIGLPQLELLNTAMNCSDNRSTPGYFFNETEDFLCAGAAVLPMLYGWDAYLIPESRDMFLYISHDEYLGIYYNDTSNETDILARCGPLNPFVFELPEESLKSV